MGMASIEYNRWRRYNPRRPRGAGAPHTYGIPKFVVDCSGSDPVLVTEGSVLDMCREILEKLR